MSQKGKQTVMNAIVIALIIVIVIVVSMGRATPEDYANVNPETVCNDVDGDGYAVDSADLVDNWSDLLNPKCPSVKKAGDCDNYDPSIHPDAEDTLGDGIDQNCDGQDGTVIYLFGQPIQVQ